MAAADDEAEAAAPRRRSSTVSCFVACFGGGKSKTGEGSTGSRSRNKKKERSSLSWRRLIRRSKTYPAWKSQKTVPVDAAAVDVKEVNEEGKTAVVRLFSVEKERKRDTEGGTAAEHGGGERARKPKYGPPKLPHEPQKPANGLTTSKHATCRRSASFNPHKPASPARSVSFPASVRRKHQPGSFSWNSGDLDPVVGMSILIVALAVLLLWGRVCAVFCTSAWFYFVPRLRKEIKSDMNSDLDTLDMDSVEYKKKVVMEGLLERSHRNSAAIL
ncbi:uncharacterized protein [Aristolochia californica]|uniref:uncharacterized protein n=1 Tax=Aristolochia californica TaxID=171875 RepID=UPI0035E07DD7